MFSASLNRALLLWALMAIQAMGGELKVCADPDNLPFSNRDGGGYENKIIAAIAAELGDRVTYVWWPQRPSQVTEALNGGLCDVIPGIGHVEGVLLTYPPYYRSAYAFVTRSSEHAISSFDDPALRIDRVGIELVGDDGANPPPATALARRGIVGNIRGFSVFGDQAGSRDAMVAAVAQGDIDVAIAWGPVAGYFAKRSPVPLTVSLTTGQIDPPGLPMAFDVSMGLRLDEGPLRKAIESAIARRKVDIDRILADYTVPRVDQGMAP